MVRRVEKLALTILMGAMCCRLVQGQPAPPTILIIDVANNIEYQEDISDPSKFATLPGTTPSVTPRNFFAATILGDIVAVNGQPAKGTYIGRSRSIITNQTIPGAAVGDIARAALREQVFEILKPDGTQIGSIMAMGDSGGPPPPGAPLAQLKGNWAIVGGTGAFLGARGQEGIILNSARAASMSEDPGDRRTNGGGPAQYILHVIPMESPQIVNTSNGPAVAHSADFSLVTASKPAAAGETLSLFVSGLGPTAPGIDPGAAFLTPSAVNSPVQVTVNGKPAQVLAAVAYPGTTDNYQVNFVVPPDAAKGTASIQVGAAWVLGAPVSIPIQ